MVSIPSSQIKNIIYFDRNSEKLNLKKLKSKIKSKTVFEEAENKGYFVSISAQYLNERFNAKGNYQTFSENDHIDVLYEIVFIDLHQQRIQRLMCLEYCRNVVYLNLSNNSISDIAALKSCQKMICLDVSSNVIEELPDFMFWHDLKSLRFLYVHDNPISEPDSVTGLCGCSNLVLLTLSNTPLSLKCKYRHFLVNSVWSLKVLDNYLVSDEEIIEDADFKLSNFRTQSPALRFPSHRIYTVKDSPYIEDILKKFAREINRAVSHLSPVNMIQKLVRGFLSRKIYKIRKPARARTSPIHKMPRLVEEKPLIDNSPKDNVKYLTIDLKHLQTSLTIEHLDRESLLVDSMVPPYHPHTYRSVAKSDQDKCSKEQITRALRKDEESISFRSMKSSEFQQDFTFRLMGINPPTTDKEPAAEVTIEKNRTHYAIREADREYHENKLAFILPEIKSKPVSKTNSNILFQKSQGCMGLFLLNKWDKTDQAVLDMDVYHEKCAKVEAIKFERDMKLQDLSEGYSRKLANIRRNHEEHKSHVSQFVKFDNEIQLMKCEEIKTKQEESSRVKSKIKKEISFSLNFRAKQSAASNAMDRFERMTIKQDQGQENIAHVAEIRQNIGLKLDGVKSFIENELCNRRMENSLEKSALDIQLFQQMNNRINEAKMRVEKLKTIHRLVSCPKLKVAEVNLESLPAS